jgi:hypothetical protein
MREDFSSAVIEAESRRCAAMLANDTRQLDALIDTRLHFTHATGVVDDKAVYLAKVAAGRITYLSIEWSEQNVVRLGEVALLTGRMTSLVRVEGIEKRLDNQVLAVWADDGAWRLIAFQSTPLVK